MQAPTTAGEFNSTAKPKRKILRYLGYGLAALVAIGYIWHWIWEAGGSNEWELAKDQDGIKIWTMKSPGSSLIRVRGQRVVDTSMSAMVKYLEDPDTCEQVGCYDAFIMTEHPNVPLRYSAFVSWKFPLPAPFNDREAQILVLHEQDPDTKEVRLNIIATPNLIDPDPCCVRITHLHNKWRFTPIGDGKIEIELTQNINMGGNMPEFLSSLMMSEGTFIVMTDIVKHLELPKFRNAKLDYVLEP